MKLEAVAELQLLAARAEASIDDSLANVRYTSTRLISFENAGPAFDVFAISTNDPTIPFGHGRRKDIILCRTPEIAKFIVALLEFGGKVVAECGVSDTPT